MNEPEPIDLPTLRALADALDEHDAKVIRIAADEIERLRARVEELEEEKADGLAAAQTAASFGGTP